MLVFIAQAFAVTEWPVKHIHVNCMTDKVIAAFGGRYYSSLKFYTVVLPEGTSQDYLQVKSGEANKFDITSSVNG